jgi:hydroxymethylbilane synthase
MASINVVRVGTRGSALARRQTDQVLELLRERHPQLEFDVSIVHTRGDANANAPLAGMGLGVFVREIEQQLRSGRLDLAVHSLKDLPTQLPDGLTIGAVLEREDPRDVQVNRWGCPLSELPPAARIGTSSPRRASQLRHNCPGVMVVPIRGNVETRLSKAQGGECDGAILAAAGLIRLGLTQRITEYLPPQLFVPPPGQGVLAVEMRDHEPHLAGLLQAIEHVPTRQAIVAERAFLAALGGGCQVPVGAYAFIEPGGSEPGGSEPGGSEPGGSEPGGLYEPETPDAPTLSLTVFIGSPDGKRVFRETRRGPIHLPLDLAADAYQALLHQGAGNLLETARSVGN